MVTNQVHKRWIMCTYVGWTAEGNIQLQFRKISGKLNASQLQC